MPGLPIHETILNASLAFQSSRRAKRNSRQESATNMIMGRSKYSTRQTRTSKKAKSTTLFYPESKTIKKLSKKKTYYVRVRAYTTEDNGISNVKVYSPWFAVKKVRTK